MSGPFVFWFALLVSTAAAGSGAHARTDGKTQDGVVQKVVQMLQENKVKVANDLKSEEAEMAEYAKFCDEESDAKAYAIKDATRSMADLNAEIDDAIAQVKALDDEIATLGTEIAGKEKEVADTADVRKKDKAGFDGTEKSLLSSIESLEKAIILIKRSAGFLQTDKPMSKADTKKFVNKLADVLGDVINAAWVDKGSSNVLKGFLQNHDAAATNEDGEFKLRLRAEPKKEGGGILATLEDMKEKAQETLSSARMQEMKSNHNFQMMTQSLTDSINLSKQKVSDATSNKAALTEAKGKAEGELAETKKRKLTDSMYLDNLKRECSTAASEWATRQKSAKGEMAAIDKAVEILTSKVKVLVQFPGSDEADAADDNADEAAMRHRLVDQLQSMGHKFNSYAMMEMAGAAAQDPFAKIRGLIEDMVNKLTAEANEEATQQAFCDEEKAKSDKEKNAKTLRSDDLRSRIDVANSQKEKLSESIKELQAELAETDKATGEATKIRAEEHASYLKASKDYKDGQAAVEEAIRVLKAYYSSQALVQVAARRTSAVSFGSNQGDAASAIISILETSAEDFARMATQLETDEAEAKAAYEKTIEENKAATAAKKSAVKSAESEIKALDVSLESDTEDLKMVEKELDAVMEYLEKLKPQCETKVMTYEEKKAKRQAEIEGLKEALSILDAPALLQATHRH